MMSVLRTGRHVLIRRTSLRDEAAFVSYARENRQFHHPWIRLPQTKRAFGVWIAQKCDDPACASFLVVHRADRSIVGLININEIVRKGFQSGYLGYCGSEAWAGAGLMTEGLGLVVSYAFRTMKLHRLEANIQPENAASLALVRRLGFRHEGFSHRYLKINNRWRDQKRYAVLREDWVGRGG
ncbi:MAG: GNAT family N-acetyltransferase [Phycisphaerales bacterium]|nr:GNAT family N-acetyltransferase [Phycisphaerales bacterium]